jgi:multidrug efflux pump subunit AcrA (membrane-fusion protein)
VKAGDTVSVTVDGVSKSLPGKVTQVGVLNTSGTSGDTTTYPVTVVLDPTSLALYDGAGATVAIDVGTANNVLTVPSSALSSLGTRSIVQVYSKGKVIPTVVTTGVSGTDRTEVKTGLTAGQQVVLANLHSPVPSSNTTTNRFARVTGGGGLGALTTTGGGGTGFTRGGR